MKKITKHIKHNEIQIEIEMKTAKTDVCTRETVEWGVEKETGEEGENESVYDANNSHIIERPQNECAPCGFYQPKDWLNTSRANVLKLRNAFLGNARKKEKETEKNSKKTKKKKPRSRLEKTVPGQVV